MADKKRTYSIAFKREVVEFINFPGNNIYKATKHFSERDSKEYKHGLFSQWKKNAEAIVESKPLAKRVPGGGRKPVLGALEESIFDEIVEMRIAKIKVTRGFIADRARMLAINNNLSLKATSRWLNGFMSRYKLSLRRITNLTTLTDEQLVQRAVDYMTYLRAKLDSINQSEQDIAHG